MKAIELVGARGASWLPNIIDYRPSDAGDPSILIMEYKSGESLDKSNTWLTSRRLIARKLAEITKGIHDIHGRRHGPLEGDSYDSWLNLMDEKFWRHVNRASACRLLNSSDLDAIDRVYTVNRAIFSSIPAQLVHFDLKPANIIFDSTSKHVSLVDFELTRFGDSDFDFVKMDLLSQRWPEYRKSIAETVLAEIYGGTDLRSILGLKYIIYCIYYYAAILTFEAEQGRPSPPYRIRAWATLLASLR